jgi:hypothetical protein
MRDGALQVISPRIGDERDRRPRYNPALEQVFLGALMLDNKTIAETPYLKPEHFGLGVHQRIFAVMADYIERGRPANPITLQTEFAGDEALRDLLGGPSFYLTSLAKSAPTTLNQAGYAKQIVDLFRARQLLALAEDITDRVDSSDPIERQVIDGIEALRKVEANGVEELEIYDAGDDDITPIPPRGWLLGSAFCRRFLSSLIADGGVGKTALRYLQYLAVVTGRNLTGEHVHHRGRVLIVCLEDDISEVKRRIRAARLHHDIPASEVKGRLFYWTPRGLKLMQSDARGVCVTGELESSLRTTIRDRRIDLVGLDPFIKTHDVPENDNGLIDKVCALLAQIGEDYDCAVDYVQHSHKGAAEPGNADNGRGASSGKDAGRIVNTLMKMSAKEAKAFNLTRKEQVSLIRLDSGKFNLGPRAEDATWFRIVGVAIGNGTELYPHGDNVQTVERWTPPDVWEQIDAAVANQILDRIDEGPGGGRRYSPAVQAQERAAWPVVQEFCPGLTEEQAKGVIATWIENDVLKAEKYEDPKERKKRQGLVIGVRPGNGWDA